MAEMITMPKLSDTMEEGVIAKWLKKEGDKVGEGDLLAEVETDKATMEYECPVDGVLLKLLVANGAKLKVGDPIAVVGAVGETVDLASLQQKSSAPIGAKSVSAPVATKSPVTTPAEMAVVIAPAVGARIIASPLAKKIAKEKNIDLSSLRGTGPQGRVIARDLQGGSSEKPQSGISTTIVSGVDRSVPVTMMRQTIAKRLHAAKNDAPHFYLTRSCDMTAVNAWRQRLNKDESAVKVSVNDIVMMATARALKQHPQCNASWQGESIREFGDVHMAMAVALPTGLITPVIRHCEKRGVREIAIQSKALAQKAKAGELKPEDYSGGTFTISNLGMMGVESFTAIINPPQAAILAVGATIDTPWVVDGAVTIQPRVTLTMSCDHRVIDGALGAQLLASIVRNLEDPLSMLT